MEYEIVAVCDRCPTVPCDTSTNSPHEVAFAPQAAKASNCQYFAASSGPICGGEAAVLLLKNPSTSKTIFYVTIESVSNYGDEAVAAQLAENVDTGVMPCRSVPVRQTNLGCESKSGAEVTLTGHARGAALCAAQRLTQDIVKPMETVRVDHQGGFVVTPGKTLAVVAEKLCRCGDCADEHYGCLNVGIDLRWWETPCNSHT